MDIKKGSQHSVSPLVLYFIANDWLVVPGTTYKFELSRSYDFIYNYVSSSGARINREVDGVKHIKAFNWSRIGVKH